MNYQNTKNNPDCFFEISHSPEGMTLNFFGRLDVNTASDIFRRLVAKLPKASRISRLTCDLSHVDYMDDYGAVILFDIQRMFHLPEERFAIRSDSADFNLILTTARQIFRQNQMDRTQGVKSNMIVQLGEKTLLSLTRMGFFISFIGSIFLAIRLMIKKPKSFRMGDAVTHMKTTGVDALPVVALISALLGLIIAFMSSLQLKQFGANIYVASLVALAMVSELGPIMTAIVVAGRSGSAYAAEISAMKISEEIDALFTMGFDPVLFLVIPRLMAAFVVVPILTLFADIFAIAGGMVIGVTLLNLTPSTYFAQTIKTLNLFEFWWGLSKSFVFSMLIAYVGCLRGFQARGGASAVGDAATSAVVTSIFLIILFDSMFAVIRSYWLK